MAGALDEDVGLGERLAGPERAGGARALGQLEAALVDVGDRRLDGPERQGGLHGQQADGAGARDQHAIAGAHAGPAAGPDADRQRLHQRAGLVGERVGQGEGEVLVDRDVVRERAVDRRRPEEHDVPAEVVPARPALAAAPTRHARLERHAIADGVAGGVLPERDHPAGGLVAQHERRPHHGRADPAVLVVVDVGPAHAHRRDLDQDLAQPGRRHRPLLHPHVAGRVQHGGSVRRGRHWRSCTPRSRTSGSAPLLHFVKYGDTA